MNGRSFLALVNIGEGRATLTMQTVHTKLFAFLLTITLAPVSRAADTQWVLEQSTLTYHVTHKLHEADGVSHAANGKGVCHAGQCDFEIAAPVKSFDSGSSGRDSHMLKVTRGEEFPMVTVRTRLPEQASASANIHADLEIQFAGQTVQYPQVLFQVVTQGKQVQISGTIPATVSDFKIVPPSLLGMKIKNEIPVRVEMTWQPQ